MKAVNILGHIDGSNNLVLVHPRGQRELNQYTMDCLVLVQPVDESDDLAGAGFIQMMHLTLGSDFARRPLLHTYIALAFLVISHQNNCQYRRMF
jgi:hypothetical protein